ncbi:sensor histidine kinase [Nitrincola alkalisediminis]|uniref:sensor histidine kinase n=1 Tax=Nitrincola alkalisediminis TaxID=1366656 RepID=UPI001875B10B|nr:sensor histidine kinase [Nitrincola alkalisediminis]
MKRLVTGLSGWMPDMTLTRISLMVLWIFLLTVLSYFYFETTRGYLNRALMQSEANVRALALTQKELVEAKLSEVDRSLLFLRDLWFESPEDIITLQKIMLAKKEVNTELLDYLLINAEGDVDTWSRDEERPHLSDRAYFQHFQNSLDDVPYLSSPKHSRVKDSRLFIAVARPLRHQDTFSGVLMAALDIERLADDLGGISAGLGLTTALLKFDGEVIYRVPFGAIEPGTVIETLHQWQGAPPDDYSYRGMAPVDGRLRQIHYQHLKNWPLLVVVTSDLEPLMLDYQAFVKNERFKFSFFLASATLILALCGWLIERRRRLELDLKQQELHYLTHYSDALKRSNDELEQFAYIASHDLRQPLRMIVSFSRILSAHPSIAENQEAKEQMSYVLEAGQRMDEMLMALLEYSRIGHDGEPIIEQDSLALVQEALVYLHPDIVKSQASISLEGEWPRVYLPHNEGVRLFQNLISNAIKFRQPSQLPTIVLYAEEVENSYKFIVEDQGIGLEQNQLDRIFLVFQRLNPRSAYEGTGIGLSICKKIIERCGGSIHAESEGINQGCRLIFTLPKSDTRAL